MTNFVLIIQLILELLICICAHAVLICVLYFIVGHIMECRIKRRVCEAQKIYDEYVKDQQELADAFLAENKKKRIKRKQDKYDREHYPLFFWKEKI